MSSQSATGMGTWVAARFSALVPGVVRSLFTGYPLARAVRFVPPDQVKGRRTLPVDYLTQDATQTPKINRAKRIDVLAPPELFLRRTLRAPKTARKNLDAMASLDLRQRTPFDPAEVFWQLDAVTQQDDMLEVTQWVIKRAEVAQWRARLSQQGYRVRQIYVQGAQTAAPIADFSGDLVPWRRGITVLNTLLLCSAVAIALAAWIYPGWIAERQTRDLASQQQALAVQAVDLRREVEALRALDSERTAFLDTILRRPLLVDTLRELTVALPDPVWISSVVYTPQRVVMNGETSGSAAEIVLALGSRRMLGNPRLSGPVQRTATGAERFEISLDLGGRN